MSQINVLVVDLSRDLKAKGIAKAVLDCDDMILVTGAKDPSSLVVAIDEVEDLLKSLPSTARCALVLVQSTNCDTGYQRNSGSRYATTWW